MTSGLTPQDPNQRTLPPQEFSRNGSFSRSYVSVPSSNVADDDDFDLQQLFVMLRRRLWVMTGVTAIAATAFSAWMLTRPPEYLGTFQLQVAPVDLNNSQSAAASLLLGQRFDQLNSDVDFISQVQILRSRSVLNEALDKIQTRYPNVTHETLEKNLKIERLKDSKILQISYQSANPEEIQFVLRQVADRFVAFNLQDRASSISRGLDFVESQIQRQKREVTSLELGFQRFRQSQRLIDPGTEANSLSVRRSDLLKQLQENQMQLSAAKTLFSSLQLQLGITPNQAVVVSNLSEAPVYQNLLGKLREVESRIALESARFRTDTPVIQALQDQRNQLLPLLEQEAQRILGRSSAAQAANIQTLGFQGSMGRDLAQQLVSSANQIQVIQIQDQALRIALGTADQQLQRLAELTRQFGQLERELRIATESLSRLLQAREGLQLESARQQAPWEVLSPIDQDAVKKISRLLIQLLLGGLSSLALGIGAVLLLEKLDRVFHSIDELQDFSQLPCLGAVPFSRDLKLKRKQLLEDNTPADKNSIAQQETDSPKRRSRRYYSAPFMESFYSLDANLRLLSSDTPIRSLVISSTSPGDGKSTVSAHLAKAAATLGRRVLLVDIDLRRPQIQAIFNLPNMQGLSTAITGGANVQNLIQVSAKEPNLHILTTGQLPPAPGRLLSSKKMQDLMQQFTSQYDLVIYDCPPLLNFVDAKLAADHADGLILVVGLGKTDRGAFKRVLDDLKVTLHTPVLGVVANGMKRYSNGYYGYDYYQRYYGYYGRRSTELQQQK